MAAAAVAVNHKNRRSDLNDPVAMLVESMPTGDEVLLEATMKRQVVSAVGNTWMVRNVVTTADELFISKVGSPEVLDQIPLHEVSLVVSKPNDSSSIVLTHSLTHTHVDEFITTVAQEKADQKALKDELRRRQDVESVSANGSLRR